MKTLLLLSFVKGNPRHWWLTGMKGNVRLTASDFHLSPWQHL